MAVGAFATYGFLLRLPELGLPVALLGGGVISALVGLLFGLPSSRIKGFYLMVTTLAAQFFLEWLFVKFPVVLQLRFVRDYLRAEAGAVRSRPQHAVGPLPG